MAGVPKPKSANPWKYHVGDISPFWKKFREAVVINPNSSTGLPLSGDFRYPQPASRPEPYAEPASKASDIAENYYFNRDFRRSYARLSVVDQNELTQLLLAQPEQVGLPAPVAPADSDSSAVTTSSTPTLSSLYTNAPAKSESSQSPAWLPPTPPGKKYTFKKVDGLGTVDEHAYFPMHTVS